VIEITINETLVLGEDTFDVQVSADAVMIQEWNDDGKTKKVVLMLDPHHMDTLCASIREWLCTRETIQKLAEEVKP
jgi:hypothetical protein